MGRTLFGLLVLAHGMVTIAMWGPKYSVVPEGQVQPPDPAHSWLLGDVRLLSLFFGVAVGLSLVGAGIGFVTDQSWWPEATLASAGASLVLFTLFFTPWWLAGIVISGGLIVAALRAA